MLNEYREAILENWRERVMATFSSEGAKFLGTQKNPFANPIGAAIVEASGALFDALVMESGDAAKIGAILDRILRITAIQKFPPSQAVAFPFLLKQSVREALSGGTAEEARALLEFESRVDAVALMAFDVYMECREQIHQMRARQIRSNTKMFEVGEGDVDNNETIGTDQ